MISRRSFIATTAAGGLMLGFHLPSARASTNPLQTGGVEINAWIVIKPDGKVIVRVARSELGQGIITALPLLVAEELGCNWADVVPEFVQPRENRRRKHIYGSMAIEGSRSVRESQEYLRQAGAAARIMLIAAAAQHWRVPPTECAAANSTVVHRSTGRTRSYGALAVSAAKMKVPEDVVLKDPSAWTLAGRDVSRIDLHDKVFVKPIFAIDVRLPDMLYAAVAHCPSFGGALKSFDDTSVRKLPGVRDVVRFDAAVAVVGDTTWHALQGLKALPIVWDAGPNCSVSSADIARHVSGGLSSGDAVVCREDGYVAAALAGAAQIIQSEYHVPFLSHAPMETMNCVARISKDRVEIWAPTQDADQSLGTAARAAGIDVSKVTIHPTYSGGGFGRRGGNLDFIAEATVIAQKLRKPIKLIWSREEDIQHDFYRPISAARFIAGFDDAGKVVAWSTRVAGQSILSSDDPEALKKGPDLRFLVGLLDNPYSVPNVLVDYAMRNTHVPVGYWRSVNHSQNGFFRECFVDEMAAATRCDPYEFRRTLLAAAPKQLGVLDAVARHAGWGSALPPGIFRGIAQVDSYGSFVACVVEASVNKKRQPKVHRVITAVDCGYVVHPDGAKAQIEGAVAWALSAALFGEITIENGGVQQGNFHDYKMLKLQDMPFVEVVLVPTGGFWGGIGEVGAPPVAPALANAIFAATGQRIRNQPIGSLNERA